jgi:hypothetical protein
MKNFLLLMCASVAFSAEPLPTRPAKLAVLKFENVSRVREEVPVENPAYYPSMIPLLGTRSDGGLTIAPKRPTERYSEKARTLVEQGLGQLPDIQLLERRSSDVIEAEYQRNRSRGGQRRAIEMPTREHGPDFLVLGTLLDISSETNLSQSYGVAYKSESTSVHVGLRVVKMSEDRIVFESEKLGSFSLVSTAFGAETHSDPTGQAIRIAVSKFMDDPAFRKAFVTQITESADPMDGTDRGLVVVFKSNPRNARIDIDGITVGQTPISRRLLPGTRYSVRVSKPGFLPWEAQVLPEKGLQIMADLEKAGEPIPTTNK